MELKSHKRHIAKAITWRLIGSLDTFMVSWFISGDAVIGFKIGLVESLTKILLYYGHERLWFYSKVAESKKRHVLKTVSWRIIGTMDTIVIGWLISGNPLTGLSIGVVEVVTKMLLYYWHERIWYISDFGIEERRQRKKSNTNYG